MRKFFLLSLLVAAFTATHAQEPTPSPTPLGRGVWTFTNTDGGEYVVRLDAILSVSQHEYVLDGAGKVTEVNISTAGSELVRFYYVEPNKPTMPGGVGQSAVNIVEEKAKEALTRAGADEVIAKVVKNYPTTTHAHTIEYRLANKDALKKLYDSVKDSFLYKRAATFKP